SLDSSKFDAENISCALHMSRHTLYRKLKTEGVSFHQLVDTVRKNKAFELLKKNQHGLSEIAFLLGFSELSSFSRAFKKWTGSSPAKFIQK
ncbi:MAG: AraC-like DNA-binding protein, partial [Psychroserpens sp.]